MSDSLELIREAIRRVQDAEALLERAERKVLDSGPSAPRSKSRAARPGPLPVALDRSWKSLARGATELSFNGGESVRLPPALAELAKVLMSSEGASQDELAPWKSYARVAAVLEATMNHAMTAGAVSNLVYRLRRAFRIAGIDEGLIESARGKGARIRLKKRWE
jgi:hypothetical protein